MKFRCGGCGWRDVRVEFLPKGNIKGAVDTLICTCQRCGKVWFEAPLSGRTPLWKRIFKGGSDEKG